MAKVYHLGKYRSGDWCRHLRPFLKTVGNKRWRKDAGKQIEQEMDEDSLAVPDRKFRIKKKKVVMKITMQSTGGFKHSYYRSYDTLEKAEAVITLYSVTRSTIFERKGQILKSYEKRYTR